MPSFWRLWQNSDVNTLVDALDAEITDLVDVVCDLESGEMTIDEAKDAIRRVGVGLIGTLDNGNVSEVLSQSSAVCAAGT